MKSNCSWSQLLIFRFLKSMVTRYMYIKERSENLPEYFPKFKLRYLKKITLFQVTAIIVLSFPEMYGCWAFLPKQKKSENLPEYFPKFEFKY